jgi:dephospho-CoA kinase
MGKTTVASHFRNLGFSVFDADLAVHQLYKGEAVSAIEKIFPDVIIDTVVDRSLLSNIVLKDSNALKTLESIIHPMVSQKRKLFYQHAHDNNELFVVYDIPLLLENINSHSVDYIVVATAASDVQRSRVLKRKGMTAEKLELILSKQMPDSEKRKKADFLVNTDFSSLSQAKRQVAQIVETIVQNHPTQWQKWKLRSKKS